MILVQIENSPKDDINQILSQNLLDMAAQIQLVFFTWNISERVNKNPRNLVYPSTPDALDMTDFVVL